MYDDVGEDAGHSISMFVYECWDLCPTIQLRGV